MVRKALLSVLPAILVACGGGGGGGGGGVNEPANAHGNQSVSPSERIKIDVADLSHRTPDIGDSITYSYIASVVETYNGEVTAEGEEEGTLSIQNYDGILTQELEEAWSNFTTRAVEASFPDGTLEYQGFAYGLSSDPIHAVDDEEGVFFTNKDDGTFYGKTYLPPLNQGTRTTEIWEKRHFSDQYVTLGTSSFSVSSAIEVLDTPLGLIEVLRVTESGQEEEAEKNCGVYNISVDGTICTEYRYDKIVYRGLTEFTYTYFVHPKIGIVKAVVVQTVPGVLAQDRYESTMTLSAVNFILPPKS